MKAPLLIINPKSGKEEYKRVVCACLEACSQINIKKTVKKGDAEEFAKNSKEGTIIVAGGDGTLNEVINGVLKSKKKVKIGLIPIGTSNIVARGFDIPKSTSKALEIIKNNKTTVLDVGKANNKYFLIGAGIGIDAHMYKNVEPLVKRFFGEIAYPIALMKTIMTHEPQKLKVSSGKKKVSCYYALICNIGRFSKVFSVIPNSKHDDGFLDVIIFQNKDIISQFRYCFGLATQKHMNFEDVHTFRAKNIHVGSDEEVIVHCDAELIGTTPVNITCEPKAITLIIP